ncbi:hypothetical protein [Kutzneria sp. CA-103260]|uniref:hypothetical protein n=1 Tax=Kutzneria sp. CA-103260 TaxID=2802641 RepID=UPI001BAD1842|nr:hypothetical protein [Kutzneria sp. CA-103260]QUQ64026.1 Glutamate--cysteine ligase [Kutzneria sp. CA-103260]
MDAYESKVDALAAAGAVLDRGMIYWDVRLSVHQPTVEVRVADVLLTPVVPCGPGYLLRSGSNLSPGTAPAPIR